MAVLVEGTNTQTRASHEIGVARRSAASLPSSSTGLVEGQTTRLKNLEGEASPNPQAAEDTLSLSLEAEQKATPVQRKEASQHNENQAAERLAVQSDASPAGSLIEQGLESAKTREAERIQEIQKDLSEKLNSSYSLRFKEDQDTGIDFFQLVEPDTGDVVRQIPAEEVLEFIKRFQSTVSGLFISEQA
jgi:flagellar protein FlaG